MYTDWQRDNFFVAVKEALGNIQGRIGVEFDHLSLDNHKWVYQYLRCVKTIIT